MTTPKLFVLCGALVLLALGCKKTTMPILPLSSVTVVNAMPTSHQIINMFGSTTGRYYSSQIKVSYGGSQLYPVQPAANTLLVRPITDTAFTIFSGSLPVIAGGIYTYFLAGDTTKPDTLLVKDNIPALYSDSSAGVRFVNLAQGGKGLSINIKGNDPSTQKEVSNLGYLQITDFKKYAAGSANPNYQFEIHDAASGDSLTTFTWSYPRFKNNTIVIAGSTDPTSGIPLKLFTVNNY